MLPVLQQVLPPVLDSTSDQPPLFDGTTRLYIKYMCPYAQRVWIVRNYKDMIYCQMAMNLLVSQGTGCSIPLAFIISLLWVPSLEHNDQFIGESLYLIKYVDGNFDGLALLSDDPAKQKFAKQLVSYGDSLIKKIYVSIKGDSAEAAAAGFDYLETSLHKFKDGIFIPGQFGHVDVVYAPFVERIKVTFQIIFKHDFMPAGQSWQHGLRQ